MGKRVAIMVLAVWVLFSGMAWPHTSANRLNNAIVGAGLLYFGAMSFREPWARYITLALGVWLFVFTALVSRSNPATFWNDAMVAVAVFVLSLLGGEGRKQRAVGPPYFQQ
jgi:hypothetical protein